MLKVVSCISHVFEVYSIQNITVFKRKEVWKADEEAYTRPDESGTNITVLERQVQTDVHAVKFILKDGFTQQNPPKTLVERQNT